MIYIGEIGEKLDCFKAILRNSILIGGETGIRTPDTVAHILPFQGSAFDHSATSPFILLEESLGYWLFL